MSVRTMVMAWAMVLLATVAVNSPAGEQVLVVEQDYNIVEQGKDGPTAKDVRQKMYIHKDMVCIDEYGGKDSGKPTESIIIDLKNKKIINLNHVDKKKVTEDFDTRRKRIDKRKKNVEEDLAAQPAGPQREKVEKLYRALLDDKRKYALAKDPGAPKKLANVDCTPIKVVADDVPDYVPFEGYLHPEIELPYDSADMLYLLQIIGEKMSDFMRKHKETFKRMPMELHLDLAAGGRLDTKVVNVTKTEKSAIDASNRGNLGSPFTVPEGYDEKSHATPRPPNKNDKPD
jgi:hypothetical protein